MLKILYRGEIAYYHLLASLIEKLYQFLDPCWYNKRRVFVDARSLPARFRHSDCAYVIHHILANPANGAAGVSETRCRAYSQYSALKT